MPSEFYPLNGNLLVLCQDKIDTSQPLPSNGQSFGQLALSVFRRQMKYGKIDEAKTTRKVALNRERI